MRTDASVLLERDVKYDYLIQSMDAIRSAEVVLAAGSDVSGVEQRRRRSKEDGVVHAHRRRRGALSAALALIGEMHS